MHFWLAVQQQASARVQARGARPAWEAARNVRGSRAEWAGDSAVAAALVESAHACVLLGADRGQVGAAPQGTCVKFPAMLRCSSHDRAPHSCMSDRVARMHVGCTEQGLGAASLGPFRQLPAVGGWLDACEWRACRQPLPICSMPRLGGVP